MFLVHPLGCNIINKVEKGATDHVMHRGPFWWSSYRHISVKCHLVTVTRSTIPHGVCLSVLWYQVYVSWGWKNWCILYVYWWDVDMMLTLCHYRRPDDRRRARSPSSQTSFISRQQRNEQQSQQEEVRSANRCVRPRDAILMIVISPLLVKYNPILMQFYTLSRLELQKTNITKTKTFSIQYGGRRAS